MKFLLVGANYRTAPLEFREMITLTGREKDELVTQLIHDERVGEAMILATCNRTEIYLLLKEDSAEELVWGWLEERTRLARAEVQEFIYIRRDAEVIRHLFTVICGLDSMILGEEQILGQVREAYQHGINLGSVSTYFHQLGSEALRVGKRVRTETELSRSKASISSAAVEMVQGIFPDLHRTKAMVLGAGEMGRLALESLYQAGVQDLVIINRSIERGQELANEYGGRAMPWEDKCEMLAQVDLVISSTSAPHYVITRADLAGLVREEGRPLVLMDIAVPRDVEPELVEVPWVRVFNIDDLQKKAYGQMQEKGLVIRKALEMIDEEVDNYELWLKGRKVFPIIREFREKAELIRQLELNKVQGQLERLGDAGQELVLELTHRIVAKILHEPTVQLKKLAQSEDLEERLTLICQLYNLNQSQPMEEERCQNIIR